MLALPREAGTPESAAAREVVVSYLRQLGYTVVLQKFSFSPATLRALPVFGAGLGGLALLLLPLLASGRAPSWAAPAAWLFGLLVLLVLAGGIGLGWVSLGESLREDANLVATRGDVSPRRWIVAHLDSKAQGHSMAGRLAAVWVIAAAIAGLTLLSLARLAGPLDPGWLALGGGVAVLAGFLAGRGRLRGRSVGARDNGTGVVAALTAAAEITDPRVGILITGAEEFGLIGARIFARITARVNQAEFINLDTLDQEGPVYLVSHDRRGEALARALEPALAALPYPVRQRRLPLGIFVDSAPLARAGAPAVTIGRLTCQTLRRIHTPYDTADDLSLEAARKIGTAVARLEVS